MEFTLGFALKAHLDLQKAVTGYGVNSVALSPQTILCIHEALSSFVTCQKREKSGNSAQSFIIARPLHSMLVLPKVLPFDLDQSTAAKGVLPSLATVKT